MNIWLSAINDSNLACFASIKDMMFRKQLKIVNIVLKLEDVIFRFTGP